MRRSPGLKTERWAVTRSRRSESFDESCQIGVTQRFTGTYRGNCGEPVAVGIDVDRLYFFDLKTGDAIS
jgi:hypothetical protein